MSPQGKLAMGRVLLLLRGDRSICWLPPLVRERPHLTSRRFTATARPTLLWPPGPLHHPPPPNGDIVISKPEISFRSRQSGCFHSTSCISRNELPSCTMDLISDMLGLKWTSGGRLLHVVFTMTCSVSDMKPVFTSLWTRCVQRSSWTPPPLLRMSSWQIKHSLSSSFCERQFSS